jgi:hypothetical protein
MGRLTVGLVLAGVVGAAPTAAIADADVTVTRQDTADCPDAAGLRRLATASGTSSGAPSTHVYHVVFEHLDGLYRADIIDATTQRKRSLEDSGPGCAPLGEAVAIVLATMWGSERDETAPAPEPSPEPTPPVAPPIPADRGAPQALPPSSGVRWIIGAGAGLAAAIVRPAAPAFVADAALEHAPLSVAVGAFWIPQQTLVLAPGVVDVQLAAGTLRGCVFARSETRVGVCGRVFAGALRAGAKGFDANTQRTRPWFAAGLEVFFEGPLLVALLRYRAAAGAIVPLHAEAFSVAGAGLAYEPPALGGLFTFSLEISPSSTRPPSPR